jgi:hypothetical protein
MNLGTQPSTLTRLTAAGLVCSALAIWIQWLSGDPAYRGIPPGPILFVLFAGIIVAAARWWWSPMLGTLISALTTVGWFVRLPDEALRLIHPTTIGRFAPGIFIGTLFLILSLLVTDVAGLAATIQNYRRTTDRTGGAKIILILLGMIFVLLGVMMLFRGTAVDQYHNLLHLTWGGAALALGLFGTKSAGKTFSAVSGVFYFALGLMGVLFGDPAMNRAWHPGPLHLTTPDHLFHMILGTVLLAAGFVPGRHTLRSDTKTTA